VLGCNAIACLDRAGRALTHVETKMAAIYCDMSTSSHGGRGVPQRASLAVALDGMWSVGGGSCASVSLVCVALKGANEELDAMAVVRSVCVRGAGPRGGTRQPD
jgi:hypothetical protein